MEKIEIYKEKTCQQAPTPFRTGNSNFVSNRSLYQTKNNNKRDRKEN